MSGKQTVFPARIAHEKKSHQCPCSVMISQPDCFDILCPLPFNHTTFIQLKTWLGQTLAVDFTSEDVADLTKIVEYPYAVELGLSFLSSCWITVGDKKPETET